MAPPSILHTEVKAPLSTCLSALPNLPNCSHFFLPIYKLSGLTLYSRGLSNRWPSSLRPLLYRHIKDSNFFTLEHVVLQHLIYHNADILPCPFTRLLLWPHTVADIANLQIRAFTVLHLPIFSHTFPGLLNILLHLYNLCSVIFKSSLTFREGSRAKLPFYTKCSTVPQTSSALCLP